MNQIGKIILVVFLVLASTSTYAQFDTEEFDSLENQILYNRQKTYGIVAHYLGLGVQYRTGKRITYFKTRMWEFELVSQKAYKQLKIRNAALPNSRRYVYGKMNDAFFLRAGMVWKQLLNRKPYWGGVEVRFIYGGGASVGIAKPYYLETIYLLDGTGQYVPYTIKTEQFTLTDQKWDDIYGRAPFTKGMGEITLHPGVYGKVGINLEFGKKSTRITAIELGFQFDVMPTGLTIMAAAENQIVFPTGYLTFSFGKRFNKY